MIKSNNYKNIKLIKNAILLVVAYFFLAFLFYFLAGDQLHYRESRGNIEREIPNDGTVELVKGANIEQDFKPKIQILEKITIQLGTYNRKNKGSVIISLEDKDNHQEIFRHKIEVSNIQDGIIKEIVLEKPLEGIYEKNLSLKIYSEDGILGTSITALRNKNAELKNAELYINGKKSDGVLSFSAEGKDKIWTGIHYWKFVIVIAIFLVFAEISILRKYNKNKNSYVINFLKSIKKYKFLISQLVSRDFKTKYKRSVLGIFWSFLNPLLTMGVQYFVFSNIFKADVANYHIYLLIGIIVFNFFSEACGMMLLSIVGNASLLTKVYIPKYVYPLARVLSSGVNLCISLAPLLVFIIFSSIKITKVYILLIFPLFFVLVFSLGLGMLLSASMVFFRDTQFLWGVFNMIWMYATPIFYTENIVKESYRFVFTINPLYYYIKFMRICILDGISPEPILYFQCFTFAIVMLVIGLFVFKKTQDKFILYI